MGQSASIVVGGEALIDLVRQPGERELVPHAGGGPYNTARTLARLGCDTRFLGMLSDDGFGIDLARRLGDDGVVVDPALTTSLPSTLAMADLDAGGGATYSFYTEGTAAASLDAAVALAALPADVAALHVGTLGLVVEPLASALRAVAAHVAPDAVVMVDLNCRPAAIPDRDRYYSGLGPILRRADVIKASVDDLAWLLPQRQPLQAARDLMAEGPAAVLLTDGAQGATAVLAYEDRHVDAPATTIADTIGAGDAFGGGFLAWWHRHGLTRADLAHPAVVEQALDFACLVAARTCERPGASPPTLADLGAEAAALRPR